MNGAMATWNAQGVQHFMAVVDGPGKFTTISKNELSFLEKRLNDGRGVRLNLNGTFKVFLD